MSSLKTGKALDDLAQHLYDFLPGQPHPYADQTISFAGVAAGLGLGQYWPGGSKRPAIRKLLEDVLTAAPVIFCNLILKVVERSITYRGNKNPLTREDIDRLNELVALVGYKIPDLHDRGFLESLPRKEPEQASPPASAVGINMASLAPLQEALLKLATLEPQQRGFAFEKFLSELFALYNLAPRGSFRLVGEQIDGSFQIGQEVYLLEAKWQASPTAQGDLLIFNGKVEGKAQWSRGLFVSYTGFSDDGLQAFATGRRTSIICMDGLDLFQVLKGRLNLVDVIDRKKRRAGETNQSFVPVRDFYPD
jgi:hypothetical protein